MCTHIPVPICVYHMYKYIHLRFVHTCTFTLSFILTSAPCSTRYSIVSQSTFLSLRALKHPACPDTVCSGVLPDYTYIRTYMYTHVTIQIWHNNIYSGAFIHPRHTLYKECAHIYLILCIHISAVFNKILQHISTTALYSSMHWGFSFLQNKTCIHTHINIHTSGRIYSITQ